MLTVVIVDDEQAARASLRAMDWESYGYRLVGEAENAKAAFEVIDQYRPDVVLADVVMPGMSGLTMVGELRQRYPQMRLVLLSMHREFDYVVEALRLGAQDYLLKGVLSPAAFFEKLDQICLEYRAQKNAPETLRRAGMQLDQFLRGGADSVEGLALPGYAAALRIQWRESPSALFQQFIEMRVIKAFEGCVYSAPFSRQDYLLLFGDLTEKDGLETQLTALEEKENAPIHLTLALLGRFETFETLRAGVRAAQAVLGGRFYTPERHVFEDVYYDEQMTAEQAHLLLDALRAQEAHGEPLASLLPMLNAACMERRISPDALKNHLINWQSELERRAARPNPEVKRAILSTLSLEDALRTLETYIRALRLENAMGGRIEVRRTMQYIQSHLDEDFSVETLARRVHFSPNHFSMIFKKEMGISLREYIVKTRMERAADLLTTTNMKVYEVARGVGMPNTNYFKQAFVKYYHVTPSAFREGS